MVSGHRVNHARSDSLGCFGIRNISGGRQVVVFRVKLCCICFQVCLRDRCFKWLVEKYNCANQKQCREQNQHEVDFSGIFYWSCRRWGGNAAFGVAGRNLPARTLHNLFSAVRYTVPDLRKIFFSQIYGKCGVRVGVIPIGNDKRNIFVFQARAGRLVEKRGGEVELGQKRSCNNPIGALRGPVPVFRKKCGIRRCQFADNQGARALLAGVYGIFIRQFRRTDAEMRSLRGEVRICGVINQGKCFAQSGDEGLQKMFHEFVLGGNIDRDYGAIC